MKAEMLGGRFDGAVIDMDIKQKTVRFKYTEKYENQDGVLMDVKDDLNIPPQIKFIYYNYLHTKNKKLYYKIRRARDEKTV